MPVPAASAESAQPQGSTCIGSGQGPSAIVHLLDELDRAPSSLARAELEHRIGLRLELGRGDLEQAAWHYKKSLEEQPRFTAAARGLRRLAVASGQSQAAIDAVDLECEGALDPRARHAALRMKAFILESHGGARDRALSAHRAALEVDCDDFVCMATRSSHEEALKLWQAAAQSLGSEANAIENDPALRAALIERQAQILECHLGQTHLAMAQYETALALSPNATGCMRALSRLYAVHGRYQDLVRLLTARAGAKADPSAQAALLYSAARVQLEHLGNRPEATALLERAKDAAKDSKVVLPRLVALQETEGDAKNVAASLEALLLNRPPCTDQLSDMHRLAGLFQEHLDRPVDALHWLEQALTLDPTFGPVRDSLVNLCTQQRLWDRLLGVYEAECTGTSSPAQRASMWRRMGLLCERQLARPAEALSYYERALADDPGCLSALDALIRLRTRDGKVEGWPALWMHADGTPPVDTRCVAWLLGASLYELVEADADKACDLYRRTLAHEPHNRWALRGLTRLAETSRRFAEQVALLDTLSDLTRDGCQRSGLQLRCAEVLEEDLGQVEGAVTRLEAALLSDPHHLTARRGLGRLLARTGQWAALVSLYRTEADAEEDGSRAAHLVVKMAELSEHRLALHAEAIELYREALVRDPNCSHAARRLVRKLGEHGLGDHVRGDYLTLAEELEQSAEAEGEPHARAADLACAAEIYRDRLNDLPRAARTFERALALQPDRIGTLLSLSGLYRQVEQRTALCDTLASLASIISHPEARACALRELAGLQAASAERDTLLGTLKAWLSSTPWDLEAALWLEHYALLYRDEAALKHAWTRLSELSQEGPSTATYLCSLASLFEVREPAKAREIYLQASAVGGGCYEAERAVVRLAAPSAVTVRSAMTAGEPPSASQEPDRAQPAPSGEAVARQYERARAEVVALGTKRPPLSLIRELEHVLEADPEHRGAAEYLTIAMLRLGAPQRLVDVLSAAAQRAQGDAASSLSCSAAAVCVEHMGNRTQAISLVSRALTRQPASEALTRALASLFRQDGQWNEARGLLERGLSVAPSSAAKKNLHLDLAALFDEGLDDQHAATEHLRKALSLAPTDQDTFERLAELLSRGHDRSPEPTHPTVASRVIARADPDSGARQRHESRPHHSGAPRAGQDVAVDSLAGLDRIRQRVERAVRLRESGATEQSVQELRQLVGLAPEQYEVWSELRASFEHMDYGAGVHRCAQAMAVLDPTRPGRGSRTLLRAAQPAQAARRTFSRSVLDELGADLPPFAPVGDLIAALSAGLGELFRPQLSSYGLSTRARMGEGSSHPLRIRADRIAEIVGAEPFDLYLHRARGKGASTQLTTPTALVFPLKLADDGEAAQVFALAQRLVPLARRVPCVGAVPYSELEAALLMFVRQLVPQALPAQKLEMSLLESVTRITTGLSLPARREAEDAARKFLAGSVDVVRWCEGQHSIALRAAALIADDLGAAIRSTTSDFAREILRFWASEVALKVALRTGIA